jgi:hypothetical protein
MIARKWGALLPTILVLAACDKTTDPVAGTNNETHTKGTLFQANGKVAAGARVRVFAGNQDVADSLPVTQTQVDVNGQVPLKLKRGYYSLLADDITRSAVFIDSVFSDGDTVMIPTDTLRPTGTLTGHIRVQPMHSPAIAWVHLMRTNLYANVDSSGAFRLSGVPAGSLDLVAVTHIAEYTPTHKLVRIRPNSTVDVDTLTLVYNGLPLVTGIAATYDSLTGVVTVTWRDTAYARKNGYVISRGQGSQPRPEEIGSTTSAHYSDTVFGGFGATPSRYDSVQMDLTYWVAAQSNDYSTGAVWSKVQLHAKSPALAKRWKVEWTAFTPLANNGCTLDTLDVGVAAFCTNWDAERQDYATTLHVARPDGLKYQNELVGYNPSGGAPTFWNGKIWIARGIPSSRIVVDSLADASLGYLDTATLRYSAFDSIRILFSPDGIHWDSTTQSTGSDQTTALQLKAVGDKLLLYPSSRWFNRLTMIKTFVAQSEIRLSAQGVWSFPSQIDTLLLGNPSDLTWAWPGWSATFAWAAPQHFWTCYTPRISNGDQTRSFLIPDESGDTTKFVMIIPGTPSLRASSQLLAIGLPYTINLTSPVNPTIWQRILVPESESSGFCFWRGQLVVLGKTGLHFATITPNQ